MFRYIETFDTISNTSHVRCFFIEASIFRHIEASDTISSAINSHVRKEPRRN